MNVQETDDPIKSRLLRKASQQQDELKQEVQEITERTEKVLTNALIIGGALALTYLVVRGFSGSKKSKRKVKKVVKQVNPGQEAESGFEQEPSVASTLLSQVGSAIATQATVLLLDLAKGKLAAYLQAQAQKKADDPS